MITKLPAILYSFVRDRRGAALIVFGFGLPVTLLAVGGAIEYGRLVHRRTELQKAADFGVLAGSNMLQIASNTDAVVMSVARDAIAQSARTIRGEAQIDVSVAERRDGLSARIEEQVPSLFGKLLSLPSTTIIVVARARFVGSTRLCLLTLDAKAKGALHLEKAARITATDCSVYSNSSSPQGLTAKDGAIAKAQSICTVGGVDGAKANFTPSPLTDCPVFKDPFVDKSLASAGATCTALSPNANPKALVPKAGMPTNIVTGILDLEPGTYCGGLHITENAVVSLRSGIYVMKDGPLIINKKASVTGKEVGLFFTGSKGGMLLDKDTTINLSAPITGSMAGFLMAEERLVVSPEPVPIDDPLTPPPPPPPGGATKALREYRIISDNARNMLGTIYLPAGRLIVDAKKPIADQSAYTVILAQQVHLYEGPNLYLNANYSSTPVPVPKGVGPTSGEISLTQ